ncbi:MULTISPECIES: hypothetical protein [Priestia]|jgi:hypothetical protein|uniref:hypothetical protein n=1 Tax=Priestia TaxID=2800373 RepID=UPI0018772541|nr:MULTISPECIES: hypothetical protein [Priestia]MBE5098121.1 hypothetical protein [Priestia aryabhattai]MDI3091937.1 hypothetical protein [Priestia megaterium]MED3863825.1 hypothetical protein [Priestia megaterium]MED4101119.1 hypothetical protein [Priestia megaterium]MED4145328.1 hypothetical protein [Priestia megaterium]
MDDDYEKTPSAERYYGKWMGSFCGNSFPGSAAAYMATAPPYTNWPLFVGWYLVIY